MTTMTRSIGGLSYTRAYTYGLAGDILAMHDGVNPGRSQSFVYDAVSRLTSADGDYGQIDYTYNLGGDRTQRSWTVGTDTAVEDYSYDPASAQLTSISLADAASIASIKRQFTYAPSGQVITDARAVHDGGPAFTYGLNARGREDFAHRDAVISGLRRPRHIRHKKNPVIYDHDCFADDWRKARMPTYHWRYPDAPKAPWPVYPPSGRNHNWFAAQAASLLAAGLWFAARPPKIRHRTRKAPRNI